MFEGYRQNIKRTFQIKLKKIHQIQFRDQTRKLED